jgi:hypothetical protein
MRLILLIFVFCSLNVFCMPEVGDTRLETLVKEAEVVALVEVTDVQTPPTFWCGQFPATQDVSYKVLEVFKGSLKSNTISHRFYVVKNGSLSDKQKPQLSPSLFARQKRHLLFLFKSILTAEPTDSSATVQTGRTNSPFEIAHVLLADENSLKELKRIL